VVKSRGRIVARGMLREGTPVEDYRRQYGLWVKREDKSCLPPGPAFSKTRGVYARVASREEHIIGVLDTYHSQAGHAVSRACGLLGKTCINYYPEYKYEPGPREPQLRARDLGATLVGLKAGRSAILFHQARKLVEDVGGYMMPNALKLGESVSETAKEVPDWLRPRQVLIPISSGTIAAGVIRGFNRLDHHPQYIIHMGYHRSHNQVLRYLSESSGIEIEIEYPDLQLVDEGYNYKDVARDGESPPWPCNDHYDLKAFRWWLQNRDSYNPETLMWNIG